MNAPLKRGAFGPDAGPDAAQTPPLIRFEAVAKTYPARGDNAVVHALDGIDLAVPNGAIVGVIGRSGAGKSTLIRLVNGLEKPTRGKVIVDGVDVGSLSESALRRERRSIGMIFQHFNLLSSRTVFDNVALPLEIAGESRKAIAERVEPLLRLVGLTDKRDRYPAELSGGQKQRVGIARALATEPKVLLCDEATSALDPETTRSILKLLAQVNAELGVTILLITHEIPVIKEICHRVAVIDAGKIVEEGPVFDVFTRPTHPVTASFVKDVVGVELPADLAARISPIQRPDGEAVIRIRFTGANATAPVISRLTSVLNIDVNILAGRIETIENKPFGTLIVSVPAGDTQRLAVLAALAKLDLEAEVIGYVA